MVGRMVKVAPVADEADERLSLDAYVETWSHETFGLPEVQAFKTSLLDYADLLARQDGVVLGSGFDDAVLITSAHVDENLPVVPF